MSAARREAFRLWRAAASLEQILFLLRLLGRDHQRLGRQRVVVEVTAAAAGGGGRGAGFCKCGSGARAVRAQGGGVRGSATSRGLAART